MLLKIHFSEKTKIIGQTWRKGGISKFRNQSIKLRGDSIYMKTLYVKKHYLIKFHCENFGVKRTKSVDSVSSLISIQDGGQQQN